MQEHSPLPEIISIRSLIQYIQTVYDFPKPVSYTEESPLWSISMVDKWYESITEEAKEILIDCREAGDILGVSATQIRGMCLCGKIERKRLLGHTYIIDKREIETIFNSFSPAKQRKIKELRFQKKNGFRDDQNTLMPMAIRCDKANLEPKKRVKIDKNK